MSDYLVYWRIYWDEVKDPFDVTCDWRTKNELFYDRVEQGDNLWVVVSGGSKNLQEWRLLQRICVKSRRIQRSKYGKYCVIGDDAQSQLFDLNSQFDFTQVLKKLDFASGRRIMLKGKRIGQALQMIRPLSDSDSILLDDYSKTLKQLLD